MNMKEGSVQVTYGHWLYASSILIIMLLILPFNTYAVSVGSESPPVTGMVRMTGPERKLKQDYSTAAIPLKIILNTVSATEKALLSTQRKDQPLRIGFGRDLPQPYQGDLSPWLTWTSLPGNGQVAAFSITSPDARTIRVAVPMDQLPQDAEVRFFSIKNSEIFGPFTARNIRAQRQKSTLNEQTEAAFWSPVIEGETVGVEIYLPFPVENSFSIIIPKIQHLAYSVQYPNDKDLSDIGSSGSCNIDVKCRNTVPSTLSAAVAKIIFSTTQGTYLCTGTLLADNDPNTFIPYFMTAYHCISNQSVANTIDSYWFFERATCGGPDPITVAHFAGGADLLNASPNSDFAFLQLRDTQISNMPGIKFAGWTTTNPTGLTAIAIHHPSGDLKKWSQGTANGFAPYDNPVDGTGSYIHVTWSEGVTEGGSSGSGLFAITGERDGEQLFVGNLYGGYSSCSNPISPDWYGRFDITYLSVSQWLLKPISLPTAVEFYHAGKDHYFNTANRGDIAFLEANPQSGWFKTGYTFKVYPLNSAPSGTVAVARYYGALQRSNIYKPDSHFYTGSAGERQILDDGYLKACPQGQGSCTGEAWFYEKDEYRIYLPNGSSCPNGSRPVYRFYNEGYPTRDSNHRYTIDTGVAADMRAKGWRDEGVKMCVPN